MFNHIQKHSTTINHIQPHLTTFNHTQPYSTTINFDYIRYLQTYYSQQISNSILFKLFIFSKSLKLKCKLTVYILLTETNIKQKVKDKNSYQNVKETSSGFRKLMYS